jgi:hypothetical protein
MKLKKMMHMQLEAASPALTTLDETFKASQTACIKRPGKE